MLCCCTLLQYIVLHIALIYNGLCTSFEKIDNNYVYTSVESSLSYIMWKKMQNSAAIL